MVEVGPDVEVVPDPLEIQVPIIREALDKVGIPIVGAAEHEADDVIGTLATTATLPVDIVTGDRDLFQLVDDAREVRVIYTARGMSNLEIVTDASSSSTKYGVLPDQYADFATLRGDSSDGLPGVAGHRREVRRDAPRRARRPRRHHRRRRGARRHDGGRRRARSSPRCPTSRSRRPSSPS